MIRQTLLISFSVAAFSQPLGPVKAPLEQRLGEVKQSIAQNQARLKRYAWIETKEIRLKGEVKKREQSECFYGPDGKVQKTPVGDTPPPKERRGIRGKIVANKIDEMKDYMDRVSSLLRRYIPPDPQTMQAALRSGKVTLEPAGGALVFSGYVKPGDKVTLTFDRVTKQIRSFAVATYLDDPKDTVTVDARFSTLPDGTNFVEESVLNVSAKQIQIKTTNFGYRMGS
jgi:hypothetical protein